MLREGRTADADALRQAREESAGSRPDAADGTAPEVETAPEAETAAETRELGVSVFAIDPGFVFTGIAEETMNSPDAQRWLPGMVERIRARRDSPDRDADLGRCTQRCLDLASGRYDRLSGRYMELGDDIDAMLSETTARGAGHAT